MICLALLIFLQVDPPYPIDKEAIKSQEIAVSKAISRLKLCELSVVSPAKAGKSKTGEVFENGKLYFLTNVRRENEIAIAKTQIENAKDFLDELQAGFIPEKINKADLRELSNPLKVGDKGTLPSQYFKIFQILGKDQMLGHIRFSFTDYGGYNGRVVIGGRDLDVLVMVKKLSTEGLADSTLLTVDRIMTVTGTETYQTSFGTRTVHILEPVIVPKNKKAKEELAKESAEIAKRTKEIRKKRKADEAAGAMKDLAKKNQAEASAAEANARDSIAKLIRGLESYEQRFEDSFKEPKESVMDQMQEQAKTYIAGADKRLEAAIKEMDSAKMPEGEKTKLVDQAKAAIAKAKKKVGLSGPAKP